MNLIELRITVGKLNVAEVLALEEWSHRELTKCFIVQEGGTDGVQTHNHYYIEDKRQLQTFRKSLRTSLPTLRGQAYYKMSQVKDKHKYQRYMCKGTRFTPPTVIRNDFNFDIEVLHSQYWEINCAIKELKDSAKEAWSVVKWLTYFQQHPIAPMTHKNIGIHIIKRYLRDYRRFPNKFTLKTLIDTIYLHHHNSDASIEAYVTNQLLSM